VDPTTGTAAWGVSKIKLAGICPAAAVSTKTTSFFYERREKED
jgi:hypothetical protein